MGEKVNDAESAFELWARKEGWIPSHRGWPDYLCRRGAELMCVEVKAHSDWLSTEQRAALIDLHALGIPTFIWTPTELLMAYPKVQNESLLSRLELAYELEQAKKDRDELRVAKEQLHTQLVQSNDVLERIRKERMYRRLKFARDFKILRRWVATLPGLPPEIHDMLKHYEGVPGAAT